MTDAWLSMAGAGSKGLPNGIPIDEWGIRMEAGTCNPVGASVSRGGAANGPQRSMRSASGTNGCANMPLRVRPATTSTSPCRHCHRAMSPSRSSGTPRLPPPWWRRNPKATTRLMTSGKPLWRMAPARTVPTGKKARSWAIRTPVRGHFSSPPRLIAARQPGSMHSSWCQRLWMSRKPRGSDLHSRQHRQP